MCGPPTTAMVQDVNSCLLLSIVWSVHKYSGGDYIVVVTTAIYLICNKESPPEINDA